MAEFVKDRGYAWVILACSLVCLTINWGLVLCFGIYFVALLEHFQCRRRDVAAVGSLAYGVLCFAGPLVTSLESRYGARVLIVSGSVLSSVGLSLTYLATELWHVYISFGVVAGLGFGLTYIPCFSILPQYFDRYQHFATSFATVGSAIGNFLFSTLLYHSIDLYTWRGSMLINAGLVLQCVVCGALMKPAVVGALQHQQQQQQQRPLTCATEWCDEKPRPEGGGFDEQPRRKGKRSGSARRLWKAVLSPDNTGRSSGGHWHNWSLFKELKYLMFLIECFCYGGSSYVVFSMVNELIIQHGLTIGESASLVAVIGGFNVVGRIIASVITNWRCTDRPLFFALATAFFTLSIFTTSLCYDYYAFALSLGIFGLTYGVKTSQIAAVLIDLFGIERMSAGMAYGVLCSGLGGFLVPPLAGWFADAFSLEGSMVLAASFSCVALGSCVTIVFLHRQQSSRRSDCEQIRVDK